MFQITPITRIILLANVLIYFLAQSLLGPNAYLLHFFNISSDYFNVWQPITYMWFHANFSHLFFNMIGLFFFGPILERYLGQDRFLLLYLISGVGAAIIFGGANLIDFIPVQMAAVDFLNDPTPEALRLFFDKMDYWPTELQSFITEDFPANASDPQVLSTAKSLVRSYLDQYKNGVPMLGASGAVYGVITTFALMFPNTVMFPIPIKAKYLILVYAGISIYYAFANVPGDNIAHLAHLGGMITAFILVKAWKIRPQN
jgi:membrane associated rhomboid family serine protease